MDLERAWRRRGGEAAPDEEAEEEVGELEEEGEEFAETDEMEDGEGVGDDGFGVGVEPELVEIVGLDVVRVVSAEDGEGVDGFVGADDGEGDNGDSCP